LIAIDSNILVYAHRTDSSFHEPAEACLLTRLEASLPWAIPWPCVYEFLGVVSHPRIYAPPTPLAVALDQVAAWLTAPNVVLLAEASGHWPALRTVLDQSQVIGPQVHDAKIAALCLRHGVKELWTADRDFGRFRGLKVVNPLLDA
jgi:toxin-antitoxin system PIN domain toxin